MHEAVVEAFDGRATDWPRGPQLQQLERQQPPQRQLQLPPVKPSRNDSVCQGFNPHRKTFSSLFTKLCEYENLLLAFKKARARKSKKAYVQAFQENLPEELGRLQWELLTGTYTPRPLKTFTVRDPKTRQISASNFRDRIVHHAICNLLEPIYEPRFIEDTFANRKGKGTKGILNRFDQFRGKFQEGFALKCDIRHYFDTVDQGILLEILGRRIKDVHMMRIIRIILENHKTQETGKGMPLGNLTSQFFANIYLAELDHFVKHSLRAKYYLRYVDDFVILGRNKAQLETWHQKISAFLKDELRIELHKDKTKIVPLNSGVQLVGFRIFRHHKLLKKSNIRRIRIRMARFREMPVSPEHMRRSFAGWQGYAQMADTYGLRQEIAQEVNSYA